MNSEKIKKRFLLDKLLMLLAVICVVFAVLLIALYLDNAEISLFAKNTDKIKESYASTESNTWDISENGDGSVIATLDENGLLTVSGIGNMKEYYILAERPFDSVKDAIKSIKIESGISNISGCMFLDCYNLTSIDISNTVINIGINPFTYCEKLTNINVDSNNMNYKDENGVLYSKDGTKIIAYPAGKQKTEYTILNGTTTIGEVAFAGCEKLTNIKIPNSVSNIEMAAFNWCINLENVEIPSGVTSIKEGTFYYCESLASINLPTGVTSIGYEAFEGCRSLESITIPNSVTNIGDFAFSYCENLINVNIPSSVTAIGECAFYYCDGLMNLDIPSFVTSIGEDAFYECRIINLVNPQNNVVELPNLLKRAQKQTDILYASQGFTLTNCTIQGQQIIINEDATYAIIEINDGKLRGLTYIISYNAWDISEAGDGSLTATLDENGLMKISGTGNMKGFGSNEESPWDYLNTVIRNIKIEEGVTELQLFEFDNFYNLKIIEIPSSVVDLGEDGRLYECNKLTDIIVDSNNTKYSDDNGVLYSKDKKQLIKYPTGKRLEEYKILEGVESIKQMAFSYTLYLKNLEIPSTLKSIEYDAVYRCYSLKNVTILEGATIIGDGAFGYCENLEKIIIPKTVTEIGEGAFKYCDNATIICEQNSYAETYAKENETTYQLIHLSSTEQEIDEINLMIKNIQPQTTMQEFKSDLSSDIAYIILDSEGNEIKNALTIIGTGCQIKLDDNTIYTIIITGDADGDGLANIRDILAINKHRLNKADLTLEYLQAADVDEDGAADIRDILQINKFRLGKTQTL